MKWSKSRQFHMESLLDPMEGANLIATWVIAKGVAQSLGLIGAACCAGGGDSPHRLDLRIGDGGLPILKTGRAR
jgi:hypothetical protein